MIWLFGVVVFPEVEVGDEVGPARGPGDGDYEGDDVIDGLVRDVTAAGPSLQLTRALGAHLEIYESTLFSWTLDGFMGNKRVGDGSREAVKFKWLHQESLYFLPCTEEFCPQEE